jgi:hypothetical protein
MKKISIKKISMKKIHIRFTIQLICFYIFSSHIIFGQAVATDYKLKSGVEMLMPEDYVEGELDTNLFKKEWWGLFEVGNHSYLKKVQLEIEELDPDIQYDWEYGIKVENNKHCKALLSGFNLKERVIKNYESNSNLKTNEELYFEFSEQIIYLSSQLIPDQNSNEQNKLNNYLIQLNLETDSLLLKQELFYYQSEQNLNLDVIWAGDIDKDGITDLLMEIPLPKNVGAGFATGLFLSSMADQGEIVKWVAHFVDSGC